MPRILVVDDERDTCANLQDIFADLGYEVDVAYDGQSALELASGNVYDVALVDLKMPDMDGAQLYRRIRQFPAYPVGIIITAYGTGEATQMALDAGAWRVVPKPIQFPQLMELVDAAVEHPLVLLIDDDEELCRSLQDVFLGRGYRFAVAQGMGSAAQHLESCRYDVVLIDMRLPEGDGAEVFRRVRAATPEARTVLVTGYRNETDELVQRLLDEGANDVCYKPFDMDQLLATVERLAS